MAYLPDLSEYNVWPGLARNPRFRAVGWLDKSHPFAVGEVPSSLVEKLRSACAERHRPTRGYHVCEFCSSPVHGVPVSCAGTQRKLGAAEIRVEGKGGIVYFAPNLILHYVTEHRYLPPAEFLEAIDARFGASKTEGEGSASVGP